jgi:hypothetical protein
MMVINPVMSAVATLNDPCWVIRETLTLFGEMRWSATRSALTSETHLTLCPDSYINSSGLFDPERSGLRSFLRVGSSRGRLGPGVIE